MTDYFFKSGSRSIIIFKLKQFFNTRTYLKTKNNRTDVFDAVFKSSIAEYQQYHQLKIQDGSLNEEIYAKIGSELSEVEIDMLAFHQPLLEQLLHGTSADNPTVISGDNPNCITKAVTKGKLGNNNIYDNGIITGQITGKAGHDGIHVNIPFDTISPVTALPAMAGTLKFFRFQDSEGTVHNLDILLDTPIKGEKYYLILKDILSSSSNSGIVIPKKPLGYARTPGPRNIRIKAGTFLGYIGGANSKDSHPEWGETGLHITLFPAKFYTKFYATKDAKPIEWFIDAARNPQSPFKCA
jgi:hypothetical protein